MHEFARVVPHTPFLSLRVWSGGRYEDVEIFGDFSPSIYIKLFTYKPNKALFISVLMGIPGAGKSTFVNKYIKYLEEQHKDIGAVHVCYDQLIPLG